MRFREACPGSGRRPESLVSIKPGGKGEVKACTARRVVGNPKAAAMRFHDRSADTKSHASAMRLGGKKSVEDLVHLLRRYPYARIAHRDLKLLVLPRP